MIAAFFLSLAAGSDGETWLHDTTLLERGAEFAAVATVTGGEIVEDGVRLGVDGASCVVVGAESAVSRTGFREALVSWNAKVPEGAGLRVELRVAVASYDLPGGGLATERPEPLEFSPWLHVADWGRVDRAPGPVAFEGGRVDVDYFKSSTVWNRLDVRLTAFGHLAPGDAVFVDRLAVCESIDEVILCILWSEQPPETAARLSVPFRSQLAVAPELSDQICSPTALAMVMDYHGVDRETLEVCQRSLDPVHGIYGNWPRAIQTAYSWGVPGYLTRLHRWEEAAQLLSENKPLIISIAAGEGELTGAPYPSTTGHLLVVTGIEEDRVWVNDPAALDAASGQLAYDREELGRAWLERGGTTYVLLPPQ